MTQGFTMIALLNLVLLTGAFAAADVRVFDKGLGVINEPVSAPPEIQKIACRTVGCMPGAPATEEQVLWLPGLPPPTLRSGEQITLEGQNFGDGPDQDLAKIVIGNTRALERDLVMYRGNVNIADLAIMKNIYSEDPNPSNQAGVVWPQHWNRDIQQWTSTQITFTVPWSAHEGPLVIQVQKKLGLVPSLEKPNSPQMIPDPITERVAGLGSYGGPSVNSKTVSVVGSPVDSRPVDVVIQNPNFAASVKRGEQIYWMFDYNLGISHFLLRADWDGILSGKGKDRVAGGTFNPVEKIGAIWAEHGQVPDVLFNSINYTPSPMPSASHLVSPNESVRPTGWVGYVSAEVTGQQLPIKSGYHTGFSCAVCHAAQVTYQDASGQNVTKVFNGIPNSKWSMKFATYTPMVGIIGPEMGSKNPLLIVDKSQLLYNIYPGTAEMTLSRNSGEVGSFYRNDFFYSPTAIPVITNHTPLRRALSRSEEIAGFEGSYIHSEEPDGAFGAHTSQAIKDLTAYMTTIKADHDLLVNLGLYRWVQFKNHESGPATPKPSWLSEVASVSEGEFLRQGAQNFPALQNQINQGRAIFETNCKACHSPNFGNNSDENMMPLNKVGSYFSPTKWQRQMGSIRTGLIREIYWVQKRGLLHDGHIRSKDTEHVDSVSLLVNPDRCDSAPRIENGKMVNGSPLYRSMYDNLLTAFRIPKGNWFQEQATRQQNYFVDLPANVGTAADHKYLYWDYQSMRKNFGVKEFGASSPSPMPETPHPYCVEQAADIDPLVLYLLTL